MIEDEEKNFEIIQGKSDFNWHIQEDINCTTLIQKKKIWNKDFLKLID